jgi:hypothetical protein
MSDTKILIPASLDSYGSRADGSLRLTFSTGIVNNEQLLVINALKNKEGYLMFKDAGISKEEQTMVEALEDQEFKVKTQSQILRNVIYLIWKKNHEGKISDKDFYRNEMQKIIDHYKDKLD